MKKDLTSWISSFKGLKKSVNYLFEFIKSDYFQGEVIKLRKKYNIPTEGFNIDTQYDKNDHYSFGLFHIPQEWICNKNLQHIKQFNIEIEKISCKFPIESYTIESIIKLYVFYNFIPPRSQIEHSSLLLSNICEISDTRELIEKLNGVDDAGEIFLNRIKKKTQKHPITISISPYASQRDIINYIQFLFPIIKKYQEKYLNKKCKFGKYRDRDPIVQEKYQLIYELKDLPRKDIRKIINDEYKTDLGYEDVSKIISLESKRRKEV